MQVKLKRITEDIFEFQPFPRKKSKVVSKQKYQALLERVQKLESWRKSLEYYWNTGGFVKKSHRPQTIILCFFADGKETVYHFHSEPDFERIRQEMADDGAEIVIVLYDRSELGREEECIYFSANHEFDFPHAELKTQISAIRNIIKNNKKYV